MDQGARSGDPGYSVAVIAGDPKRQLRLMSALNVAGISVCAHVATAESVGTNAPGLDLAVLYETGEPTDLLNIVRATKEALPEVVLLTVWPGSDSSNARKALRAGADGLVSDLELETTLGPAIRAARSGLVCIPRPMRAPLESESLSMREKQVLGMLVTGFTNAEIAEKLYLAESTVKSHLSSAYTKLGVRSRKDAATMILDPVEGLGPGILAISVAA